jgi:hypothetical protein
MMHYNDIVVSICDSNRKALREYDSTRYDNGRQTKVHMPFETEYQILVKNNQTKNVRLDIDIDGANVTNEGIVIRPWYTVYLERFLNSQNKFKFVPVSNEGVGDPTSKENGIITVTSHFELEPPRPVEPVYRHNTRRCGLRSATKGSVAGGSSGDTDWMREQPMTYSKGLNAEVKTSGGINYSSDTLSANSCIGQTDWMTTEYSTGEPTLGFAGGSAARSIGQAGATVEGSKSNQEFSRVHWRGDDPCIQAITFKFKLLGMDNMESKEWQEYMRLKEKFAAA